MIKEFYEGKDIFITGGSGVIGKAIIEKLLRSCNVRTIYVLMRSKRKFTAEQRLEKLRKDKIFFILHESKPEVLNKIIAIPGDACSPKLGITGDYAKLMAEVSVILHCAATVRFDEGLVNALRLNVGGTYEAIQFAKTLKHLKVFMHVSTFFSNPYLKYVDSKIYDSPMDWRFCMRLLELEAENDLLDTLTKKMITGFPNTYTFTKNIAESLVNDHRHELPVAVTRPSIVIFSLDEPIPGFPPGAVGAAGLFALVAAGMLKTVYLKHETRFDITPLDIGVKCILVYTVDGAKFYENNTSQPIENIPVTSTSSTTYVPQTFKFFCETTDIYRMWEKTPILKSFLLPGCIYTGCRFYYMLLMFGKQVLPAILLDLVLRLFGQPPVALSLARKSYISLEVMKPFMFNTWQSDGIVGNNPMLRNVEPDFSISKAMDFVPKSRSELWLTANMIRRLPRFVFDEDEATTETARTLVTIKKCIYNGARLTLAYYAFRWFYTHYVLMYL